MLEINMKWVVRLVLFLYMCYRAVYGAIPEPGLSVEQIDYGEDGYLQVGTRKTLNCKGFNRNQRLEWVDPFGNVVKRVLSNRVFTQEHFVASPKGGRAPGLVLTLNQLKASDSGVYQCRSGNVKKEVPVCVLDPSIFIEPKIEVTAEVGRAITLSCQARGDPEPRLVWSANGYELTDSAESDKYRVNVKYNTQGFESLLTILSLEPSDSKVYTCTSLQESPMMDDCTHTNVLNITLNVNHEPVFENYNDTELVYGKEGQVVNLVCTASGYPLPSYRWFKDLDDTLLEFEQKQIVYSEVDNQAVLSVTAGPTTFGQKYKCKATNAFGESDKQFMLLRMEKPSIARELNFIESSDTEIVFNITYDNVDLFPIEGFDIQYFKLNPKKQLSIPKEAEWRRATSVAKEVGDSEGNTIKLDELEAESKYWVRARAINDVGVAPWSLPELFTTSEERPVEEEPNEDGEETKPVEESIVSEGSDGTFYGIFFAGGIFLVGAVCMFAMRWV